MPEVGDPNQRHGQSLGEGKGGVKWLWV